MITLASITGQAHIKSCPVVRRSRGVVHFTPALVKQIAGAVQDSIEWIALLNGTRSADGYEVTVDRFTIPQQYRGAAHADIPDQERAADVVGVMHLHPWWSQARFSGIDDNTLNPRYPFSIVVSPSRNNLGFSYEAMGKVVLPCGAVGEVEDFRVNVVGVERFAQQAVRPDHNGEVQDLGDCTAFTEEVTGEYTLTEMASCGLTSVADTPAVFGRDDAGFLDVVKSQTLASPTTYFTRGDGKGGNSFFGKGGSQQGHRGKRRGGKRFSARKDGLYRVQDTEDDVQAPQHFEEGGGSFVASASQGCDWCHTRGMLRKDFVWDEWLCRNCWAEGQRIIADCVTDSESMLYVSGEEQETETAQRTEGIVRGLLGGQTEQRGEFAPRWHIK